MIQDLTKDTLTVLRTVGFVEYVEYLSRKHEGIYRFVYISVDLN
jgi:hypothetical protein